MLLCIFWVSGKAIYSFYKFIPFSLAVSILYKVFVYAWKIFSGLGSSIEFQRSIIWLYTIIISLYHCYVLTFCIWSLFFVYGKNNQTKKKHFEMENASVSLSRFEMQNACYLCQKKKQKVILQIAKSESFISLEIYSLQNAVLFWTVLNFLSYAFEPLSYNSVFSCSKFLWGHGKTTSDIRMTYESMRVANWWHTSSYKWHMDDIRMTYEWHTNDM